MVPADSALLSLNLEFTANVVIYFYQTGGLSNCEYMKVIYLNCG